MDLFASLTPRVALDVVHEVELVELIPRAGWLRVPLYFAALSRMFSGR